MSILSALSYKLVVLGLFPNPQQPGKWRLITDLSSPEGFSINEGIASRLSSLSYTSVDEAVTRVLELGRSTVLAKFDIQGAYRLVPVHPVDRVPLGMKWYGALYVDAALPFGLRLAPKLFTAVADALLWILGSHGVGEGIHYLDNFLILGQTGTDECGRALALGLELCRFLGVTVAIQKTEGPATSLSFLGIVLNTEKMVIQLPQDKI